VPQIVFVGKVIGIADGDTLTVLHNGAPEKIRLFGIDAPEKKQPFGDVAKRYASTRAFGKVVGVRVIGLDRYKRSIGVVELPGGTVLNVEMVRVGLAWWYREYAPREKLLEGFERQARAARVGLWRDAAPVEPSKWRHKKR
jgi:endonuclease YncB( thermonuclease family)